MISKFQALLKPEIQLESHQVEGVKYALLHHYHLNCDAPGVGKTLQALTTAFFHQRNKHFPTLCVVPSYLAFNWELEIEKFSKTKKKYLTLKTGKSVKKWIQSDKGEDFVILSYGLFRANASILQFFKMVIWDEVHYLKSIDALVSQAAHAQLEMWKPPVMVGLTGTPVKNRVPEFYSLLCLCAYNTRGTSGVSVLDGYSFWDFKNAFCYREKIRIGARRFVDKFHGLKNKEGLKLLLRGKYIRRTNEVLGLEEPIIKDIYVNYRTNPKLLEEWENFNKGVKKSINSTIKKEAALKVAPATAKVCKDFMVEQRGPIVVFTCHPDVVEIIHNKVGKCRFESITGSTSNKIREKINVDFQEGLIDVLVCSIGAASTGLNLFKSNTMIFNDEDWVPENNTQAMMRILRKGQTKRCSFYFMRGSKSEKIISQKLQDKSKTIKELLEE